MTSLLDDLIGQLPPEPVRRGDCDCNFCMTGERDGLGHDDGDNGERLPLRDLSDLRAEGLLP